MPDEIDACAHDLMETVPPILQFLRQEMRRERGANLTVPQFRALRFLQRHPTACLSDLAEHLGLTPPSTSKLVDGLVKQALVARQSQAADRRRLSLRLTPAGEAIITAARAGAQARLAQALGGLAAKDLRLIRQALSRLRPLFAPPERP